MRNVVMFSGGVGSWAAAKRVAQTYGTDDLVLLFADVKGQGSCLCGHPPTEHINGRGPCERKDDEGAYCGCTRYEDNPHIGEDEDCYRFIKDAAANVGGELVHLNEGRSIWEVFRDHRMLGNTRIAKCSHVLKQGPARKWLDEHCDPADTAIYVGIDWTETHRIPAIERNYLPYLAFAPLTEPPYLDKEDMLKWCANEGLVPPRMYAQGYPHANCGGGCVRAGQGQFKLLYETHPERYAYWEAQEQGIREHLGKDVAILRDRRGGTTTPLTLRSFREMLEVRSEEVEADDIGGCGCFVENEEISNG